MKTSSKVTFRFLAEPSDINFGGKVHGGAVMKWIDSASYACASQWSGNYCVTVYVGGIRFIKPVLIGHMVEVCANLIYTGKTSMHISVDVYANDPKKQKKHKTTHCVIVFVAVDEKGKPTKVPSWKPKDKESKNMEQYAKRLIEKRDEIDKEMEPYLSK